MSSTFEQDVLQALMTEDRPEAMVNAVKIAGPGQSFEEVFSAVMEMENKNYIKLVYCQHPTMINIQLTLLGLAAIQK